MAPKTRNQTPSTPASSKSGTTTNLPSVVTPDKAFGTRVSSINSKVPKKDRKRTAGHMFDDKEKKMVSATASNASDPKTPEITKKNSKDKLSSPPAKKIKAKPRTKKHTKENVDKFMELYKQIETTQPIVPTN